MKTFYLSQYPISSNKHQTRFLKMTQDIMYKQPTRSYVTDYREIFHEQRVVHLMNSDKISKRIYHRKTCYIHEDNFK